MIQKRSLSKLPLVSVIIPCYNSEKYLSECIDSVLSQDYENIEIIAVDDGSTDGTLNILKQFKTIYFYTQPNSGACSARNKGFISSSGKYIKFLDSDDFLEPNVISKQVELSEALSDKHIVYGDYYLLREAKKKYTNTFIGDGDQTAHLIINDILTSTPLHRRSMLDHVGGFDTRFQSSQEWNLHIRLSSEGFIFHHQPLAVFNYRIHQSLDRISIKREGALNNHLYEVTKLEMTEEKLSKKSTGDVKAALALKYWSIAGKQYLRGEDYKSYLAMAKGLSRDYRRYWSTSYRLIYALLGFRLTQKIIDARNRLLNGYRNKYV
ncbi:glycosyltransferase [Parahaliea sp. F7430]|uniref:Glycosyltransferase n=1 Tax=Sediminihaliea albiluteola TaxID=2758564 RepID=A0A7W2TUP7_9GAMM|nr:glycosyltransferase [Sediminihaliea albiluteola]MBA6412299.1 glycosyltransferase [Sediminihaliea albiluteola]